MALRKVYRKLTEDQKKRGVIFSSTLTNYSEEQEFDTIHEVYEETEDKDEMIKRLLDDKFFKDGPWKYNLIRR